MASEKTISNPRVVDCTKEQFDQLVENGSITVDGITEVLSEDTDYRVTFYPTTVLVNGGAVEEFDADSKLDKNGGVVTGDLHVTGDLYVEGSAIAQETESLQVADNYIVTNSNSAQVLGYTGTIAKINDQATNNAYGNGIYDPVSDTLRLGLGTYENGEFTFADNHGQAIVTRADSTEITHNILMWNAQTYKLVDSGKDIGDLATKTELDGKLDKVTTAGSYRVYTISSAGGQGTYNCSYNADGYTIPMRLAGGVIAVGTPTEDTHAANKAYVDTKSDATNLKNGPSDSTHSAVGSLYQIESVLTDSDGSFADSYGWIEGDEDNPDFSWGNHSDSASGIVGGASQCHAESCGQIEGDVMTSSASVNGHILDDVDVPPANSFATVWAWVHASNVFAAGMGTEIYANDTYGLGNGIEVPTTPEDDYQAYEGFVGLGKYNDFNPLDILEVGCGTYGGERANALSVRRDGTVIAGKSTASSDSDKTLTTKDYVDTAATTVFHFLSEGE